MKTSKGNRIYIDPSDVDMIAFAKEDARAKLGYKKVYHKVRSEDDVKRYIVEYLAKW